MRAILAPLLDAAFSGLTDAWIAIRVAGRLPTGVAVRKAPAKNGMLMRASGVASAA